MSGYIHLLLVVADDVFEEDFPKLNDLTVIESRGKGSTCTANDRMTHTHTHWSLYFIARQPRPTPALQMDKDEKSAKCIQCKSVKGITKSNSKVEILL